MRREPRLLVIRAPGRMSRSWIDGIEAGAARLGVLGGSVDLEPIWRAVRGGGGDPAAVHRRAQGELAELVRRAGITHAVGYVHNGVFDFGLAASREGATSALASLGVEHVLLWSDHPNWAIDRVGLDERLAPVLSRPGHRHVVKSPAAAEEAGEVLGWRRVGWSAMGEDFDRLRPATGVAAEHDAVVIMGDAGPLASEARAFLDDDDPEPGAIARRFAPAARRRLEGLVGGSDLDGDGAEAALSFALAVLDALPGEPSTPSWRLAQRVRGAGHERGFGALSARPMRWYDAVDAWQSVWSWRRRFWVAWLARRARVGVYGSDASALGVEQTEEMRCWVPNDEQPAVYARGRCALNVNAGHDEAGPTHKPFQIAASGVPMVHHASPGLSACFEPGSEVLTFERGPELLAHVRRCVSDGAWGAGLAGAARSRGMREHRWAHRVQAWLGVRGDPGALVGEVDGGVRSWA